MKEVAMSIPQFCKLQRAEITLYDIRRENGIESFLEKIMENNKLKKLPFFTLANTLSQLREKMSIHSSR